MDDASALLEGCPAPKQCEFRLCEDGWCEGGTICESPGTNYLLAMYWATVTITSVGYGDIHATAGNKVELVMATIMVLMGAVLWASLVGTRGSHSAMCMCMWVSEEHIRMHIPLCAMHAVCGALIGERQPHLHPSSLCV